MEEDFSQPMREGMTADEKKAQEERRRMIVEAVRLDGRKKKVRKQKEGEWIQSDCDRGRR